MVSISNLIAMSMAVDLNSFICKRPNLSLKLCEWSGRQGQVQGHVGIIPPGNNSFIVSKPPWCCKGLWFMAANCVLHWFINKLITGGHHLLWTLTSINTSQIFPSMTYRICTLIWPNVGWFVYSCCIFMFRNVQFHGPTGPNMASVWHWWRLSGDVIQVKPMTFQVPKMLKTMRMNGDLWLVGGLIASENMKVSWDDSSQYMEK